VLIKRLNALRSFQSASSWWVNLLQLRKFLLCIAQLLRASSRRARNSTAHDVTEFFPASNGSAAAELTRFIGDGHFFSEGRAQKGWGPKPSESMTSPTLP
jgi:hypothetical protein